MCYKKTKLKKALNNKGTKNPKIINTMATLYPSLNLDGWNTTSYPDSVGKGPD